MRSTPHDVEDVLSEAYVAALIKLQGSPSLCIQNYNAWFRAFLFRFCLKLAARAGKQRKLADELTQEYEVLTALHLAAQDGHSPEGIALAAELRSRLTERERFIVDSHVRGLTSDEIALTLQQHDDPEMRVNNNGKNWTAASVRKVKSRALKKLRTALGIQR